MKILFAAFIILIFGFEFFWWKKIVAKSAFKMLLKLTTGVNFTIILQAAYLCISFMFLQLGYEINFWQKEIESVLKLFVKF